MEAPKSFEQTVTHARTMLAGLTPGQKLMLVAGAVLTLAALWWFSSLFGNSKFVVLYSGLKTEDARSLAGRLASKNISYQLSPDGGSLLVPEEQLDASRLETASAGLPRNARMGFELFDTPNWAGSDFSEKVNYQRALEGELERTLQTLNDVESVRVHLVLPRESLYSGQEQQAKAAVIVKTHAGRISELSQRAIPELVASAVDGLRPENVTLVDADSNTPLLHRRGGAGDYGAYDQDDELVKTVLRTLEPVVGEDRVRASIHVEYDLSTSDNTEETYDPKAAATLTEQKSEENVGAGGAAGIPGTASNVPGGTASTTGTTVAVNPETSASRSENTTYAISKSLRHTSQPPGRVKRIAAAVLVDDAIDVSPDGKATRRKRTPEEMKQIEQLAGAAIGFDAQRGDLLSVQNLAFATVPSAPLAAPTRLENTRNLLVRWSGQLRYLGILALFLIVYFLILRPVKRQVLTAFRELPGQLADSRLAVSDGGTSPAEIQLLPGAEQARRAAELKKTLAEKIRTEPAAATRLVQGWLQGNESQ